MDGAGAARPPSRRAAAAGGAAAALVFLLAWLAVHAARPPQPTADVYTHLSVARHLVRGEGFLSDVAYPLSFAFPCARALPQPLVHRRPGLALLLTVPVAAAGDDPARALAGARLLMALLLAGVAGLGAGALLARGRPGAVVPWLLLLGANPLIAYGVDWGFEEVPAALLLLALWLRAAPGAPRAADGLLAGALGLLRLELLLVPVLWWATSGTPRAPLRRWLLAVGLAAAVLAPWAARDLRLSGRPVFLLQADAELVKDTRAFPGYAVYRGLDPQPPRRALADHGVDVLRKTWRGLRFFRRQAGGLVPLPVAWGAAGAALVLVVALLRRRPQAPAWRRWGRAGLALLGLAGLYACFDHSLRHLLVLVPVLLWETSVLCAGAAAAVARRVPARPAHAVLRALLPAALAANLLWLFPSPLPGWRHAAAEARRLAAGAPARAAALAADPARVPFTPDAASPWYADRAAVWDPGDPAVAARLRALLSP